MENCGGGAKKTIRFGFSWADEVEREEREQNAMQQPTPRVEEKKKREQIKPDPFGVARPREVVLAKKGVDWRARDLELELAAALRPPRSAARGHRHAAATAEAPSARASGGISASACAAAPARGVHRDAGRTPRPPTGRRNATSVSRSARGGGKRKFSGEGPERRARPAGDHTEKGRRVFGELNVGNGSFCASAAGNSCDCNPGGSQTEVMKAATAAAAADGAPSTAVTVTGFDESAAGRKRMRGGKGIGQDQEAANSAGLGTATALISDY